MFYLLLALGIQFFIKIYNTFEVKTFSLTVWFNRLGLWKIGQKWPFFLHKRQIICNNNKAKAQAAKSYMHCFGFD